MAAPQTTDHWNSGTLPKRALYSIFEQVAHAAGMRVGKSGVAKKLADAVFSGVGGTDSTLLGRGATVVASTLLNADFFASAMATKLGLPKDKVTELANEGLDEFVRGTIAGASGIDQNTSIDQQNEELRRITDEQFGIYVSEVARRNAHLLREIILVPADGVTAWHMRDCPQKASRVGHDGVERAKWMNRPKGVVRAACICQQSTTFRGTLNEVFDHLTESGDGAMVGEVYDLLATDAYKDVREAVLARANQYDQATVGMVERALGATDPHIQRGLVLELVGMQPAGAAQGAAAAALNKGKKILTDLTDPTSPTRQRFDRAVKEYSDAAALRRKAMKGQLKPPPKKP